MMRPIHRGLVAALVMVAACSSSGPSDEWCDGVSAFGEASQAMTADPSGDDLGTLLETADQLGRIDAPTDVAVDLQAVLAGTDGTTEVAPRARRALAFYVDLHCPDIPAEVIAILEAARSGGGG